MLLADDVCESEDLLVHHPIGSVDDGQLDGVIVVRVASAGKLQLYPQILVQFGQAGSPKVMNILEYRAAAEEIAQFLFIKVHGVASFLKKRGPRFHGPSSSYLLFITVP